MLQLVEKRISFPVWIGDDLRQYALPSYNEVGKNYQDTEKRQGKFDDLSDFKGRFSVRCIISHLRNKLS